MDLPSETFDARSNTPTTGFVTALSVVSWIVIEILLHPPN